MSSAPTQQEVWKNARWLVQAVDPNAGLVRVVEMTSDDYREASFLDDRIFERPRVAHLLKWNDVAAGAPADLRRDARWIFHIGHVGSTLVARMLGELEGVLSIREPRAFRDLNFFPPDVTAKFVPTIQALFSRTFGRNETALVKTTSSVSEMAGELIPEDQSALFLYTRPRSFISGILSGENSRKEMAGRARKREMRAMLRGAHIRAPRTEADFAATAWACEMTALEAVEGRRILWANFDRVLDDLEGSLRTMADFLGFEATDAQLSEIANGPLIRRYSKASEFEYSPELRRNLLAWSEDRHRADINRALAMLVEASETSPLLRKALKRAQAES